MGRLKDFFRSAFNLEWDSASPEDIKESILSGSKVQGTNMCILILAIFIASIGLNMNSTAIIIGAMLISPLMGGIMAIGYGIATNNLRLARNAFLGLFFQIILCIVTSTLYFSLTPISVAHSELLARTSPTIWDVLIAIFGGLAGIIGVTRREKTNVLPGVAIATALMPPLCTAGFGLAARNWSYFTGAMYLFFINSFFICISTIIVIRLMRLPCKQMIDSRARRRLHISIVIIAIITVLPSIYLGYQIAAKSMFENTVANFLSNEFSFSDTQLVQSKYSQSKNEIEVALIGKRLNESQIQDISNAMEKYNLKDVTLKVTQTELEKGITPEEIQLLIEQEMINKDEQNQTLSQNQEIENLKSELLKYKTQLLEYQSYDFDVQTLSEELKAINPAVLDFSLGASKNFNQETQQQEKTLVAIISVKEVLSEEQKAQVVSWLEVRTQVSPVLLFESLLPEEPEAPETQAAVSAPLSP